VILTTKKGDFWNYESEFCFHLLYEKWVGVPNYLVSLGLESKIAMPEFSAKKARKKEKERSLGADKPLLSTLRP